MNLVPWQLAKSNTCNSDLKKKKRHCDHLDDLNTNYNDESIIIIVYIYIFFLFIVLLRDSLRGYFFVQFLSLCVSEMSIYCR